MFRFNRTGQKNPILETKKFEMKIHPSPNLLIMEERTGINEVSILNRLLILSAARLTPPGASLNGGAFNLNPSQTALLQCLYKANNPSIR